MKLSAKILVSFLAFTWVINSAVSQNNVIDEIVWVVGDEAILKSEVEEYRKEIQMQNQRIDGDPYCFIPEQLAINKLFLDQAKLDSIEINESNVTRMVEYQLNEYIAAVGTTERLEEYFSKSIKNIREDLRTQIRDQQLIQGVQQKHFEVVTLTPSEIRKFYTAIPQDSLPFIPTTLEVQIITVEPVVPLAETDAVKDRLRDYTEQINSGENSFSTLALLYSEDPSAVKGGELGFMSRSGFVPEFSNVAFALNDPSKVSNIVETEYGFHIIQLIERRGDMANFRHILLKPKIPQVQLDTAIVRLDSIRNGIVNGKLTFDEAATFLSADKDTRNNRGIMVNSRPGSQNTGTPRFQLSELNQDIARVVGDMKVGELSEPFIMVNDKGQQVAAMVKVTTRNEGHTANINNDYQIIKQMAENARRQELMDDWLQKKIETIYVRIDPEWKGCDFKYKGWLK
ncbi:MAG: peptidylprolyl isomerase [Bacteroidia bacterium]|nr:peptidylprolyl isomerase [Bacteroidia bacterium]